MFRPLVILMLASATLSTPLFATQGPDTTARRPVDTLAAQPAAPAAASRVADARGDSLRAARDSLAQARGLRSRDAFYLAAGVAVVLAMCTFAFLWITGREVNRRGGPAIESHWGGFGGGLGGWKVSPSLFYLLTALAFALMLTVLASHLLDQAMAPGAGASRPDTTRARADSARKG